jgi:hypothetical protein
MEPVTVKLASDLDSVSSGCAPPSVNVYLPSRIARSPLSSTLDSVRGSRVRVTSLLAPAPIAMRWKPASEWMGPSVCGVFR